MAELNQKPKRAYFHRAYVLRDGKRQDPVERDWSDFLKRVGTVSFDKRTVNDHIFEPSQLTSGALLGIHKPINTDFMSQINSKVQSVEDMMKSSDEPEGFAYSTAIHFLGIYNVFALSRGDSHSPNANIVASFLDEFAPPGQGAFWKTEPVIDGDQLSKFRSATGVVSFSSKFSTARNLFTDDAPQTGISSLVDRVADYIGGDIEISINVKLPPESRSKSVKTKLLDLILKDLPRVAGKDSGATSKAVLADGMEEELSLVAHRLAEDFEITKLPQESHQFSELLKSLYDVSDAMQTRVKAIIEG